MKLNIAYCVSIILMYSVHIGSRLVLVHQVTNVVVVVVVFKSPF